MNTAEFDSAVGCTPQSLTSSLSFTPWSCFNYLGEIANKFENILTCLSDDLIGSIQEKTEAENLEIHSQGHLFTGEV